MNKNKLMNCRLQSYKINDGHSFSFTHKKKNEYGEHKPNGLNIYFSCMSFPRVRNFQQFVT